jgi:hypothetical protein
MGRIDRTRPHSCYAHGVGAGSGWVRDVKPGDECDVFGPRNSIDVRPASGPLAVFGDETSIDLALRYPLIIRLGPPHFISNSTTWKPAGTC